MTAFNVANLKPASKSTEFASGNSAARSAKAVLLAGIDNQLALYKDAKKEGRRWFTVGKTEIAFSLRYQNKALKLFGEEKVVTCPVDQFEGAMAHFRKEVEKGAYKDQLTVMEAAGSNRLEKMRKARVEKKGEKPQEPAKS